MTPFTICAVSSALDFTRTGTLLYHSLLDLFPMSDWQSQLLSASVHLSSRSLFSKLWVADLLSASCSRPLILSLIYSGCHFGVVFFQPPFLSGGMKYLGLLRWLGCLPNIAGTSGHFWLPRLYRVSLVLGIGVTFLKTDGQPRVWSC